MFYFQSSIENRYYLEIKMIKDCKTAYLLGDKHWYPYQSIQLKKQLDFATDFAAHFNDDEIKHCREGAFCQFP